MYCIPIGCCARRPKLDASGAEDVGAAFSMRAQVRYTSKSRRRMPRRIMERYGSLAMVLLRGGCGLLTSNWSSARIRELWRRCR